MPIKWQWATSKSVQNHSKAPDIHLRAIILLACNVQLTAGLQNLACSLDYQSNIVWWTCGLLKTQQNHLFIKRSWRWFAVYHCLYNAQQWTKTKISCSSSTPNKMLSITHNLFLVHKGKIKADGRHKFLTCLSADKIIWLHTTQQRML